MPKFMFWTSNCKHNIFWEMLCSIAQHEVETHDNYRLGELMVPGHSLEIIVFNCVFYTICSCV